MVLTIKGGLMVLGILLAANYFVLVPAIVQAIT